MILCRRQFLFYKKLPDSKSAFWMVEILVTMHGKFQAVCRNQHQIAKLWNLLRAEHLVTDPRMRPYETRISLPRIRTKRHATDIGCSLLRSVFRSGLDITCEVSNDCLQASSVYQERLLRRPSMEHKASRLKFATRRVGCPIVCPYCHISKSACESEVVLQTTSRWRILDEMTYNTRKGSILTN